MHRFLRHLLSISILLAWLSDTSAQTTTPPKSDPPEPPARTISVERILAAPGQGYFPVALRLRDGRIAVVLRGGGGHLTIHGRLDIIFSSDDGKTWTKPTVVVDTPLDDRNPAFGQAADGTLVVAYWRTAMYDEKDHYNPNLDKEQNTWVTRSPDGGRTWTEPAQIDISNIGLGSPFGRILTLPDGTMLMAVYGFVVRPAGEKVPGNRQHSYVFRSTDNGQTWKRIAEIGDGKEQLSETALLRLPDGRILAAMRTRGDEMRQSESADGGQTWSPMQPLAPVHFLPGDLCLLPDGRVLLTMGCRQAPFGVVGLVGDSHGHFDWEKRFALVTDAVNSDCGYPSSITLPDGRILTMYYATGAKDQPTWRIHAGAVIYQPPAP